MDNELAKTIIKTSLRARQVSPEAPLLNPVTENDKTYHRIVELWMGSLLFLENMAVTTIFASSNIEDIEWMDKIFREHGEQVKNGS